MIKVEEKGLYGSYRAGHDRQNYTGNSNRLRAAAYSGSGANPSFSGKSLTPIQEQFLKLFSNREAKLFNFMKKTEEFIKGELGGIVITAVGTGLVAPFPIAFNPFVKAKPGATQEEKEEVRKTKAYSAMRQPISAAVALLIQAGVQKPIDKFLQNLTNDAETAAKWKGSVLNQTSLNDEAYLKRKIKNEFKDGTLKFEDGKIFDMSKDGIRGTEIGTAKDLKEAISTVQKMRTKSQLEVIAKTLESEGVIRMGNFNIDNNITAEVVNDCIDKYMEAITDMKSKPEAIDFHTRRAEVLINNETELKELIGKDALKDLPRFTDTDGIERIEFKKLKNLIEAAKSRASNDDVKQILDEILQKNEKVMESRCERTIERIKSIKDACGGNFDADTYHLYMQKQNRMLQKINDNLEKLKIKDLVKATPEQIKEVVAQIPEVLYYDSSDKELQKVLKRNKGLFIPDAVEEMLEQGRPASEISAKIKKKIKGKVFGDIAQTYKEYTANKFKLFKQLTKVGVGVFITLPISCTVLNWIYPRFMDLFFPKLAGTKKEADAKKNGGVK